ncbi:MAG: hypothetical protein WD844_01200 [Thermoleophilaceae bacterium]
MAWDDDDWVGTPPEGRHSRERADPAFWRRHVPISIGGALIVIVALVVILLAG